uniref:Uncharacterized protein n=1 Tax=Anguilla anguilla TaxID=7936 RepID=A0A0E9S806_ANGAN
MQLRVRMSSIFLFIKTFCLCLKLDLTVCFPLCYKNLLRLYNI